MEDSVARWAFGTGIPPSVFDNPLWASAFASIRNAPSSMIAPKRIKLAGPIANRLHESDDDEVTLILNDSSVEHFGFSASTDKATVHHESIAVISCMLPLKNKPVLHGFSNHGKAVSLSGGSSSADEASAFIKQIKKTRNSGKCLMLLTTDTPTAMRSMFDIVVLELPQLFWQPDLCHR